MKKTPIAAGLVLVASMIAGAADAASLRHQCRRECKALIETCAPRRIRVCVGDSCAPARPCRRARNTLLARCRDAGPGYCAEDWGPTVNRCNRAWAESRLGEDDVMVTFDPLFGDYSPECLRVSVGARVTFVLDPGFGDFASFPLVGGQPGAPDPSSPFSVPTTAGNAITITLTRPGFFPYTCAGCGALPVGAISVE
ncbi:MAG TPA: hypothetical protein VKA21_14545 [Candidatus Binatia bacterium]|nr:hypothetical protein [Candidatus Binatia bacterium]